MQTIKLSYVLSTRNRLPFLQINLGYLLKNIKDDEEIIVVDGNSSDGTQEYLKLLHQSGKIHQYVSEPDKNQAHGFNKALMLAKGEIIKKIIDDDLFCFPSIQICKDYMINNHSCDLCISDCLNTNLANYKDIGQHSRLQQYQQWKAGKVKSFTFGDVSLLLRRSSIPYLGLYDSSFTMLDYEFSLRTSYLKANIAYYTGFNAMSIFNPNSVSSNVTQETLKLEGQRTNAMYEYAGDDSEISHLSKLKIFIGKSLQKLGIWERSKSHVTEVDGNFSLDELADIYEFCYQHLNRANLDKQGKFF
jgi:glycosyltransferase involved in cell wall biosynthesis